ncbi:MAG: HlyD family efflux transporter periplasmic adaptor subunit [Dysgonamonadaceae bacterium]|jgi:HlyD family secretion protein|nr:HlyD family efflux transporter periplasmic adaptor subunit [Dysgonamonadaceae bacterium]
MIMNKIVLLLGILFVLSNCGKKKGNYDASGSFEATEVLVSSQVAGQIMALDVEEGQYLTAYEAVGYIDTVQLFLKRKQLLSGMKAVDSRSYDISLQIASLKQQIEKQQTELVRFGNLLKSNAATQKQVDDIQSSIDVLQKQLAAQTENLRNSNKSISAESLAIQAQVEQTDDMIRKSIIYSPINGTVLEKYVEKGEFAAPGKALFKIADLDRIFLRAYITADQLNRLKLNQEVAVFADFGKKEMKQYAGTVTWISDKAEFTPRTVLTKDERANLVYALKVAVKNDGYLKIGMHGELTIDN